VKTIAANCGKKHEPNKPGNRPVMQQQLAALIHHNGGTAGNKQVAINKKAEYFSGQGHFRLQMDHDWC